MIPYNPVDLHGDRQLNLPHNFQYTKSSSSSNSSIVSMPTFVTRRLCHIFHWPNGQQLALSDSPFFEEISAYFKIPLNQLTFNFFELLCGVMVIFNFYNTSLSSIIFHSFNPKKSELGVFYIMARHSTQQIIKDPLFLCLNKYILHLGELLGN